LATGKCFLSSGNTDNKMKINYVLNVSAKIAVKQRFSHRQIRSAIRP
jgi:hypothetical protein